MVCNVLEIKMQCKESFTRVSSFRGGKGRGKGGHLPPLGSQVPPLPYPWDLKENFEVWLR